MAAVQTKTVLITGCSTASIGWAIAKAFHERGYHVFATARDTSKVAGLSKLGGVDVLQLDVTDTQSIARCRDEVSRRTGGRLDILINNAGAEFVCPLLDVDIAEAKSLFEVNFWGPLAMVQAFAPLLIEAKGLISNHTSIAYGLPMVWAGAYAASKAALTRISDIMRLELQPLGVRVVTTYCGSVDTPMFNRPGGRMNLPESSYYRDIVDVAYKQRMDHQKESMSVDAFANQVVGDVVGGAKVSIWRGTAAGLVRFATWAFPQWYIDRACNMGRGLELVKRHVGEGH